MKSQLTPHPCATGTRYGASRPFEPQRTRKEPAIAHSPILDAGRAFAARVETEVLRTAAEKREEGTE